MKKVKILQDRLIQMPGPSPMQERPYSILEDEEIIAYVKQRGFRMSDILLQGFEMPKDIKPEDKPAYMIKRKAELDEVLEFVEKKKRRHQSRQQSNINNNNKNGKRDVSDKEFESKCNYVFQKIIDIAEKESRKCQCNGVMEIKKLAIICKYYIFNLNRSNKKASDAQVNGSNSESSVDEFHDCIPDPLEPTLRPAALTLYVNNEVIDERSESRVTSPELNGNSLLHIKNGKTNEHIPITQNCSIHLKGSTSSYSDTFPIIVGKNLFTSKSGLNTENENHVSHIETSSNSCSSGSKDTFISVPIQEKGALAVNAKLETGNNNSVPVELGTQSAEIEDVADISSKKNKNKTKKSKHLQSNMEKMSQKLASAKNDLSDIHLKQISVPAKSGFNTEKEKHVSYIETSSNSCSSGSKDTFISVPIQETGASSGNAKLEIRNNNSVAVELGTQSAEIEDVVDISSKKNKNKTKKSKRLNSNMEKKSQKLASAKNDLSDIHLKQISVPAKSGFNTKKEKHVSYIETSSNSCSSGSKDTFISVPIQETGALAANAKLEIGNNNSVAVELGTQSAEIEDVVDISSKKNKNKTTKSKRLNSNMEKKSQKLASAKNDLSDIHLKQISVPAKSGFNTEKEKHVTYIETSSNSCSSGSKDTFISVPIQETGALAANAKLEIGNNNSVAVELGTQSAEIEDVVDISSKKNKNKTKKSKRLNSNMEKKSQKLASAKNDLSDIHLKQISVPAKSEVEDFFFFQKENKPCIVVEDLKKLARNPWRNLIYVPYDQEEIFSEITNNKTLTIDRRNGVNNRTVPNKDKLFVVNSEAQNTVLSKLRRKETTKNICLTVHQVEPDSKNSKSKGNTKIPQTAKKLKSIKSTSKGNTKDKETSQQDENDKGNKLHDVVNNLHSKTELHTFEVPIMVHRDAETQLPPKEKTNRPGNSKEVNTGRLTSARIKKKAEMAREAVSRQLRTSPLEFKSALKIPLSPILIDDDEDDRIYIKRSCRLRKKEINCSHPSKKPRKK